MNKFLIIFICSLFLLGLVTWLMLNGMISNPFRKAATPAPVIVTPIPVVITAAPVAAVDVGDTGYVPPANRNQGNEARIAGKAVNIGRRFFF